MAQIVEAEIFDARPAARPLKRHPHVLGVGHIEHPIRGLAPGKRRQHRRRRLVQVDNPSIAVLGLGQQHPPVLGIHIQPAQPQNLAPAHPGTGCQQNDRLQPRRAAIEQGAQFGGLGRQQKPLSKNQLARQLGRFGIKPRNIREGDDVSKGYLAADFADAWERYLSPATPTSPDSKRYTTTTCVNTGQSCDFQTATTDACSGSKNGVSANKDGRLGDGGTMSATAVLDLVAEAEATGLRLRADRNSIQVEWPATLDRESLQPLLARPREHKPEVVELVRQRASVTTMPKGIRLLAWSLKPAPVFLERWSVVTDPDLFARTTLSSLEAKLANPERWLGWSVRELLDRLEQVGVRVALEARP